MKYFSMFSGIGGFELGIKLAYENKNVRKQNKISQRRQEKIRNTRKRHNVTTRDMRYSGQSPQECIGFSEIDKYAIQIFKKHFNHKNYGNATTINTNELPDFDLLVGGFPCQSFSIAGKRKGFDDTRGTLFFEIVRILRAKRPKYLLLENVKGLLSSKTTLTFKDILDILFIELTTKQNICQTNFTPIKSWEMVTDNLSVYLQSIEKTNGLQERLLFLHEEILPIIKKLNLYQAELTQVLGLSVEEWDLSLKWLNSKENILAVDMYTLEKIMGMLGGVGWLLKKHLEGNLKSQKLSTILTEINKTIDLKTYLYAIQEMSITLFIEKQRKLSTNLWKKISSNLIKEIKNTYYVKTFNIILHELRELGYNIEYQILNSKNFGVPQNRERVFFVGHLGKGSGQKVFPIGESNRAIDEKQISKRLSSRNHRITTNLEKSGRWSNERDWDIRESTKIKPINNPKHSNNRVFSEKGISPTLNTMQGGNRQPFIQSRPHGFNKGGKKKIPNVRESAIQNEMINGVRRLTPTECERLQGFPDGWTKYGIDEKGNKVEISDTQRYKCLGNAVTVNVIESIINRL